MSRVLIIDFGAIARRGLLSCLGDAGVNVLTEPCEARADERLSTTPVDAVVLNLDAAGALARAQRIAASFPDVKVIACSTEQPEMLVLPPHRGTSYVSMLTAAQLTAEVKAAG